MKLKTMRLPSLNYLFQQAKKSAIQFPLTLIAAFLAVLVGMYLLEQENNIINFYPYINALLSFALGIPLFFCVTIFSKKLELNTIQSIAVNLLAILVLVLLYFTLPNSEQTASTFLPYIRYTIYNIAIHLLVSFAPYLNGKQLNGFWQYNRLLFTRILLSAIYSGFLYVGIALALVSLNLLFDIRVDDKLYGHLFIIITGFFNTWFFVAGMPNDFNQLDEIEEYPFGLKVFSQYILLPLLLLYLVILYFYGAKIMLLWDWPRGVVTWLIIAVAVLGIFAFLLIYPFGQKEENSWIKKFSKAYYFVLFPLVIILFIAIGMRLSDYGITINRYIVLLLGIWLTILCVYFMIGKNNIKFIPISLFVIMILMSFGPWSMFSISEKNQAKRLKAILTEHGILKDGSVINEQVIVVDSNYYSQNFNHPNSVLVNDSVNNEIISIINYLDDYHGFNALQNIYTQDFETQISAYNKTKERWSSLNEAEIYTKALGLEYKTVYTNYEDNYYNYSTPYEKGLIEISGYDYMIEFDYYFRGNKQETFSTFYIEKDKYELKANSQNSYKVNVLRNDTLLTEIDFESNQKQLFKKYGSGDYYDLTQDELSFTALSENVKYKVTLSNLSLNKAQDKLELSSASGMLFLKFTKE